MAAAAARLLHLTFGEIQQHTCNGQHTPLFPVQIQKRPRKYATAGATVRLYHPSNIRGCPKSAVRLHFESKVVRLSHFVLRERARLGSVADQAHPHYVDDKRRRIAANPALSTRDAWQSTPAAHGKPLKKSRNGPGASPHRAEIHPPALSKPEGRRTIRGEWMR